jgi:hypothetical protein
MEPYRRDYFLGNEKIKSRPKYEKKEDAPMVMGRKGTICEIPLRT